MNGSKSSVGHRGLPGVPLSRRSALRTIGAGGVGALAAFAGLSRSACAADATTTIVSWASAGQRWEFPEKGVLPLFKKKFPNIDVQIFAEPIGDMLAKTAVAMASKSDRYDVIFDDYNYSPQFIAEGALENLDPYLDRDPEFKKDILSDIPENVLDLYRDKPAAEGGKLYGLPPDSNCQMQYYRADIFEKAGLKPAETWVDVIENAKELSKGGVKVTGTTMRRGFWAGAAFITLLRCHGGDWFDKMAPGGWKVQLDTDEGHQAMDVLTRLVPYMEPTALNASDDEANTAMLNGTWTYAPFEWGGSTMNDPKYTSFADVWKVAVVAKGANDKGRHAPHMGGLGLIMPVYSHNKDAAWEWIKFCSSGDRQDPAIGQAWVENAGQPARLSLLKKYTNIRPYFTGMMASLPVAMRFLPIPESNALYEIVGTEIAAVVIGQTAPDQALKNMQKQATRVMTKVGYYKT
ncbi:MAG: multiple sugar transport system substrate-binding protein [Gammaproteobacteria bacterium]|jgi:ABC-type glycerol-3-phosphate transport system substrate-binding protein|nr:multiple sugar transport system substrate-binding protein [Gammaproteobacteria bacterium]